MDIFRGKKGNRIYRNREDAEYLASLARQRDIEAEILKVRIKDGDLAEKEGFTIHKDISIGASPPSAGEQGWTVLKGDEDVESLGKAIEIIEK